MRLGYSKNFRLTRIRFDGTSFRLDLLFTDLDRSAIALPSSDQFLGIFYILCLATNLDIGLTKWDVITQSCMESVDTACKRFHINIIYGVCCFNAELL